jgi:phage terminase large subunit-like protein
MWDAHEILGAVVPDGTAVAGGFDGSENDDWTAIRLETEDGFRFTPTYGPNKRPAYWNPAEWGGSIPRGEVAAAVDEIATRYRLRRFYCDPRDWRTEIGEWALKYGEEVVLEWSTYRIDAMFLALKRFRNDLKSGRNKHDGDPVAKDHMLNARMIAKPGDKYILGKPDEHRKIDIAMADTLAHEAAADLHAIGDNAWMPVSKLTRVRGKTQTHR